MTESGTNKGKARKLTAAMAMIAATMLVASAQESRSGLASLDSANSERLLRRAEQSLAADSTSNAFELAEEALQYAMRSDLTGLEIRSLNIIADIHDRDGSPGDAIPYFLRLAGIQEAIHDTASLIRTYTSIAGNYNLERVYEKEAEYYARAIELVHDENNETRAAFNEKAGLALLSEGMIDSSLYYFERARKLYSGTGETRVRHHIVRALNMAGRYRESVEESGILFLYYSDLQDLRQMAALKNNMGYSLTRTGDYEKAALAYLEAVDYGEQAGLPVEDIAQMRVNSGICLQNQQGSGMGSRKQSALVRESFRTAIGEFGESGHTSDKSRVENMLALVYYHEGDLYNAGSFSRDAIGSAREAGDPQRMSEAFLTYSRVLREGNDPIQALDYYENYLVIRDSLELEERILEQDQAGKRQRLEKSEQDLRIRLKEEEVRELAIRQLSLQLENEEREKDLMRKEQDMQLLEQERLRQSLIITRQQNEAEKQLREKQILEQDKRISDLRLEQEIRVQKEQEQEITLLEQQTRLDQLELNRQKTTKKVLVGFSILGLAITVLIVISLVSSRKKNVLLASQKDEIELKNRDLESKNEEISAQRDEIEAQRDLVYKQKDEIEQYNLEVMKSIEYARKIQSSTLPDLETLNTTISDYFLLFRPRDIVSGDFFWTANVESATVLTVSDCTGHGVPGAFMSMLGMSLLKEIVQKEYITQPGIILRRLRKGIITALGQKGISGEQRDGMDMALLTIDHENRTLQYSGAYNPLYLAREKGRPKPGLEGLITFEEEFENGYVLYEMRADKMPIAHFERMDRFSNHELEVLEGDKFYLFTDGYADQFGGPLGKKFKYKPFKRLILKNSHLAMEDQRKVLEETLTDWMGNHEQVDDICIMGISI